MAMRDETFYMKLVDLKCRYVQKQPASLSILEKHDRVKALNEDCNEVLGCHMSESYPND
jgi:hypothetical protein